MSSHHEEKSTSDCAEAPNSATGTKHSMNLELSREVKEAIERSADYICHPEAAAEVSSPPQTVPEPISPEVMPPSPCASEKVPRKRRGLFENIPRRKSVFNALDESNREDRIIQNFNRRRHDRYTWERLENERRFRDRDNIIAPEVILQRDRIPSLPPSLNEVVRSLADVTGLQYTGTALAVLAALLIAIRGRVWIRLDEDWREIAVVMLLQSAPSGSRKTQFVTQLCAPFKKFMDTRNSALTENDSEVDRKRHIVSHVSQAYTRKKIRRAVAEALETEFPDLSQLQSLVDSCVEEEIKINSLAPPKINPCTVLVNKCTQARCVELLQENGGALGCITDEADMLTSALVKPQHGIPALVLHGHTGQSFNVQNCRRKVNFPHIAFPMINVVQPNEMARVYENRRQVDQGLAARFVPFFYGSPCRPREIEKGALGEYHRNITRLLEKFYTQDCNAKIFEIGASSKAKEILNEFRIEVCGKIRPAMPASADPYCEKACGLAARLALALHAWNCPDPLNGEISEEEMSQACDLVWETFYHAAHAHASDGVAAYPGAIRIIATILRINPDEELCIINGGLDSRCLEQRLRLTRKEINNFLRFLEKCNILSIDDDSSANLKIHLHRDFFSFFRRRNYD